LARQAILGSVKQSSLGVDEFAASSAPARPALDDYLALRAQLMDALRRESDKLFPSFELPAIREKLNRAFERAIVDPLRRQAHSTIDMVDWGLTLAAAELLQQWHYTSPLVVGSARDIPRGRPWENGMGPEELKQRMAIVDRMIAIKRGLGRKRR
jgi:hypothetical protein